MRQVDVRLNRDAGRQRGQSGQFGVGGLLAADQHRRDTARDHGIDAALPGAVATENPDHHDRGAGQQVRQFFFGQPRRIDPPIVFAAGPGADQVGVGRRQQQDGRLGHPPFVPQRASAMSGGMASVR